MENLWHSLETLLRSEQALAIATAVVKILVGLLMARLVSGGLVRFIFNKADAHGKMLLKRISFYTVFGLFAASALVDVGFELSVLLGAAGILTVAVGFASQTSASNLISGLFLLGERAFIVGDVIKIGDTKGEVLSIDLLSVKLRTFDNLMIRIPNENLIKSEITNLSRFPIRRIDLQIGVAYKEDLERVEQLLTDIADRNPLCLEEPRPLFILKGFGDSSLDIQFSVWTQRTHYLEVKTRLMLEIKAVFDAEGVEIPFPHQSLYTGSATAPFPIRIVPPEAAPSVPTLPPLPEQTGL